jgi:hypothetical protein
LMNKATSSFVPARLPAGTLIAGRTGRAAG